MTTATPGGIGFLLASVQRALLGEVTPELRAVAVSAGDEGVTGRFIFDSEATSRGLETVADAETEVIADFGGLHPVEFSFVHLPRQEPLQLLEGEAWAYRRFEPGTAAGK